MGNPKTIKEKFYDATLAGLITIPVLNQNVKLWAAQKAYESSAILPFGSGAEFPYKPIKDNRYKLHRFIFQFQFFATYNSDTDLVGLYEDIYGQFDTYYLSIWGDIYHGLVQKFDEINLQKQIETESLFAIISEVQVDVRHLWGDPYSQ